MTTRLITVEPGDTLSHATNLLRQHQFHHLPVVSNFTLSEPHDATRPTRRTVLFLEGLLTSQDVDLVVALAKQGSSSDALRQPWQEQRVVDVMHRASIRVTPTTSIAAAAQILVERGLNALPVVEYGLPGQETRAILVGLLTRSDLLLALARSMGAFEPGMQLDIALPLGAMKPLIEALTIAEELHTPIRSIIVAPLSDGIPGSATLRLGTINPAPLLVRLQEAAIVYAFANPLVEGETDG
jgi:acetoin utilization protein AcuB